MKLPTFQVTLPESLPPKQDYRSGFWNEEPDESMQPDYTPPGRCLISESGIVLGEGCYLTQPNHHGE